MKRLDRAAALATAAGLALCALLAFVNKDALDSPEVEIVVNGEVVERLSLAGEAARHNGTCGRRLQRRARRRWARRRRLRGLPRPNMREKR